MRVKSNNDFALLFFSYWLPTLYLYVYLLQGRLDGAWSVLINTAVTLRYTLSPSVWVIETLELKTYLNFIQYLLCCNISKHHQIYEGVHNPNHTTSTTTTIYNICNNFSQKTKYIKSLPPYINNECLFTSCG